MPNRTSKIKRFIIFIILLLIQSQLRLLDIIHSVLWIVQGTLNSESVG